MLQIAIQTATLLSVVVAILGFAHGIRVYRRQSSSQIFLEYTARYENIMQAFPEKAFCARLDLCGDPPDATPELSIAVLRYLNLCSEEYYLHRRKYLPTDIWRIWEAELKRTLGSPLLIREWKQLRREFESYPAFLEYVDGVQEAAPKV